MAGTPEFKSATTTTRRSGEEVRLPALRPMCAVGWGEARWADEVSPQHQPECAPAYCDRSWPLPPTLGVPSSTREPSRRALRSRRPMSPPLRSPPCLSRPQSAARAFRVRPRDRRLRFPCLTFARNGFISRISLATGGGTRSSRPCRASGRWRSGASDTVRGLSDRRARGARVWYCGCRILPRADSRLCLPNHVLQRRFLERIRA